VQRTTFGVGRHAIGVVVGASAFGTEMVFRQIEQFAADLDSSQVEEMSSRFHAHAGKCPMEADHGILENIVGRFPAVQFGITLEHFAGEPQQAFASVMQQGIARGGVSGQGAIDQALQLCIGAECGWRRQDKSLAGEGRTNTF
jgi:hypothetical protein